MGQSQGIDGRPPSAQLTPFVPISFDSSLHNGTPTVAKTQPSLNVEQLNLVPPTTALTESTSSQPPIDAKTARKITLQHLINFGVLNPGDELGVFYNNTICMRGRVDADGAIRANDGNVFTSVAKFAKAYYPTHPTQINVWRAVCVLRERNIHLLELKEDYWKHRAALPVPATRPPAAEPNGHSAMVIPSLSGELVSTLSGSAAATALARSSALALAPARVPVMAPPAPLKSAAAPGFRHTALKSVAKPRDSAAVSGTRNVRAGPAASAWVGTPVLPRFSAPADLLHPFSLDAPIGTVTPSGSSHWPLSRADRISPISAPLPAAVVKPPSVAAGQNQTAIASAPQGASPAPLPSALPAPTSLTTPSTSVSATALVPREPVLSPVSVPTTLTPAASAPTPKQLDALPPKPVVSDTTAEQNESPPSTQELPTNATTPIPSRSALEVTLAPQQQVEPEAPLLPPTKTIPASSLPHLPLEHASVVESDYGPQDDRSKSVSALVSADERSLMREKDERSISSYQSHDTVLYNNSMKAEQHQKEKEIASPPREDDGIGELDEGPEVWAKSAIDIEISDSDPEGKQDPDADHVRLFFRRLARRLRQEMQAQAPPEAPPPPSSPGYIPPPELSRLSPSSKATTPPPPQPSSTMDRPKKKTLEDAISASALPVAPAIADAFLPSVARAPTTTAAGEERCVDCGKPPAWRKVPEGKVCSMCSIVRQEAKRKIRKKHTDASETSMESKKAPTKLALEPPANKSNSATEASEPMKKSKAVAPAATAAEPKKQKATLAPTAMPKAAPLSPMKEVSKPMKRSVEPAPLSPQSSREEQSGSTQDDERIRRKELAAQMRADRILAEQLAKEDVAAARAAGLDPRQRLRRSQDSLSPRPKRKRKHVLGEKPPASSIDATKRRRKRSAAEKKVKQRFEGEEEGDEVSEGTGDAESSSASREEADESELKEEDEEEGEARRAPLRASKFMLERHRKDNTPMDDSSAEASSDISASEAKSSSSSSSSSQEEHPLPTADVILLQPKTTRKRSHGTKSDGASSSSSVSSTLASKSAPAPPPARGPVAAPSALRTSSEKRTPAITQSVVVPPGSNPSSTASNATSLPSVSAFSKSTSVFSSVRASPLPSPAISAFASGSMGPPLATKTSAPPPLPPPPAQPPSAKLVASPANAVKVERAPATNPPRPAPPPPSAGSAGSTRSAVSSSGSQPKIASTRSPPPTLTTAPVRVPSSAPPANVLRSPFPPPPPPPPATLPPPPPPPPSTTAPAFPVVPIFPRGTSPATTPTPPPSPAPSASAPGLTATVPAVDLAASLKLIPRSVALQVAPVLPAVVDASRDPRARPAASPAAAARPPSPRRGRSPSPRRGQPSREGHRSRSPPRSRSRSPQRGRSRSPPHRSRSPQRGPSREHTRVHNPQDYSFRPWMSPANYQCFATCTNIGLASVDDLLRLLAPYKPVESELWLFRNCMYVGFPTSQLQDAALKHGYFTCRAGPHTVRFNLMRSYHGPYASSSSAQHSSSSSSSSGSSGGGHRPSSSSSNHASNRGSSHHSSSHQSTSSSHHHAPTPTSSSHKNKKRPSGPTPIGPRGHTPPFRRSASRSP